MRLCLSLLPAALVGRAAPAWGPRLSVCCPRLSADWKALCAAPPLLSDPATLSPAPQVFVTSVLRAAATALLVSGSPDAAVGLILASLALVASSDAAPPLSMLVTALRSMRAAGARRKPRPEAVAPPPQPSSPVQSPLPASAALLERLQATPDSLASGSAAAGRNPRPRFNPPDVPWGCDPEPELAAARTTPQELRRHEAWGGGGAPCLTVVSGSEAPALRRGRAGPSVARCSARRRLLRRRRRRRGWGCAPPAPADCPDPIPSNRPNHVRPAETVRQVEGLLGSPEFANWVRSNASRIVVSPPPPPAPEAEEESGDEGFDE